MKAFLNMLQMKLQNQYGKQLPNPNIRNCVQIGHLVKNEKNIEMAIADEIQNFKEYGGQEK